MTHNDGYWRRKRAQQLKKKIRAARSVLRDCAQKSDSSSDMFRKASSQLANFQTQLDALNQGAAEGAVVPVRPLRHDRITVESLGGYMMPNTPPPHRKTDWISESGRLTCSESAGLSSEGGDWKTAPNEAPVTPLTMPAEDSMSDAMSDGPPDLLDVASPMSPPRLSFCTW